MRHLTALSNISGLPINEVLHRAAAMLFDQTRIRMQELVATAEAAGSSLGELLSGSDAPDLCDLRSEKPAHRAPHRLPSRHAERPVLRTDEFFPIEAPPVVAAESADDNGDLADKVQPGAMALRETARALDGDIAQKLDLLVGEIERVREEVRLVWQAIDELHDDAVHALRNPSELSPRPFRLTSMALDPTDPDFAAKLNAVPEEILERLRREVASGERLPPAPSAEDDPADDEEEIPAGGPIEETDRRVIGSQRALF